MLVNQEARVYARKPAYDSLGHGFDMFGCAFRAGERYELDSADGVSAFTPPAISLAGPVIGYAVDVYPNDDEFETGVFRRRPTSTRRTGPRTACGPDTWIA
jgi:hypothetical protein